MPIDPNTGLNKSKNRRGTSPGSLKAARANAKRVGAKKGEPPRALVTAAFASDATLATLTTADGHTLADVERMVREALEDVGLDKSPAFRIAAEQIGRTTHRIRYLAAQGDGLTVPARAELLELERSLQKQMASLLLTPEAQIRNGVPERRAAAERAAAFDRHNPNNKTTTERIESVRNLIRLGQIPGAMLIPVGNEPLDPVFEGLVCRLITEGRIANAFLAAVPPTFDGGV